MVPELTATKVRLARADAKVLAAISAATHA
jgi:hypothetical protein